MTRHSLPLHLWAGLIWLLAGRSAPASAQTPTGEGFVVTPDSVRLYYRVVGSGEEVVIIPMAEFHGSRLDRLARNRRLVLYDPRGRGRSDAVPPARVSLDYQLRDLDAIRQAIGVERTALIGWSGLGMEMWVYAARNPERVTRLVQLAPVPPRGSPYMDDMMRSRQSRTDTAAARAVEELSAQGGFRDDPAGYCRARNRVSRPASLGNPSLAGATPDVCLFPNEWADNIGPYFEALLGSFGDFDWRPQLAAMRTPRLVIHGELDNIPLAGSREWVAGQPAARLLVVPGAGHWPHYESPELVLAAIEAFLAGEWPPTARAIP
jgi:pimeloyl-ACP methyl ester carboxylesterase